MGPFKFGRRGGIRTRDPLHPMQVRYQAALHAEAVNYSLRLASNREQRANFLQLLVQFKHGRSTVYQAHAHRTHVIGQ